MGEIILEALDGGNPLAFLAALGSFRISSIAWSKENVRLYWKNINGGWRPCIHIPIEIDKDAWVSGIYDTLSSGINGTPFQISADLNLSCHDFKIIVQDAQDKAEPANRSYADFIAAFGCESVESIINGKKSGLMSDTALRTMSGAGNQHFLGFMQELIKTTLEKNIYDSVFKMWTYSETGISLRWDPTDDRRYALRWVRPSIDPVKTVRGANRLAIEGLPFFPTVPGSGRLETTGFSLQQLNIFWTWPIWICQLSVDAVRSLLSLPELQRVHPNRKILHKMGIEEVYRSQRITQGKYRNFTMAVPV